MKKFKKELQCPVCDQIPASLPIPCCPSGHILCKECKENIVFNWEMRDKPCPVCRTPLGRNTSYLAGTLISSFTDIPCSNKIRGCSFQGTLDEIKTHLCQFKMIACFVCDEECLRKDFFSHNNKDCFLKDVGNTFSFPTESCFYLIREGPTQQEVLVEAGYDRNEDDSRMAYAYVGFTSFGVNTSKAGLAMTSKMKIVVEEPGDPSFKLEVVTSIDQTLYKIEEKIEDCDVVLAHMKEKKIVRFEMIY